VQEKTSHSKVYFKGLHALRFFAAVLVLISHMEMIKAGVKVSNIYGDGSLVAHVLESLGPFGVTFFFVLSGFLITYLLLVEKERKTKINIKNFYLRRVLRIWPIYIIFTLTAFFILPEIDMFNHYYFSPELNNSKLTKLLMYLLFIPGFTLALFTTVPWAGHLWSIGVEEQFYLAWPWFFRIRDKVKFRNFFMLFLVIVVIKAITLLLYNIGFLDDAIKEILAQSKFECMIVGGAGALWIFKKKGIGTYTWLTKPFVVLTLFLLSLTMTFFLPEIFQDILHIAISPLFLGIIVGVSFGKSRKVLDHRLFIKLGNLSYSIYLLHMVGAVIALRILPSILRSVDLFTSTQTISYSVMVYTLAILITIALSAISYSIIERPFLNLKTKFAVIKSGK
jgi:peptidoglycan/LPS O-acetylase OafA/YrhL